MRIAVNTTSLSKGIPGNEITDSEFLFQLAISNPKQTFIFIYNKPYDQTFNFPVNVIPVVTGPEADSSIKWRIWYNIKIPLALKKYKADVFVSEKFCSLKTKIPQILISPDLTYILQPTFVHKKHLHFYRKYTARFLNTADKIIVRSIFLKKELINKYKINEEKIQVIYNEINKDFKPLSYEERELIKEKYAEGNEYFIYRGIIDTQQNLLNLLKAFSFFKKRQKSKMQLLITGNEGIQYDKFIESLKLYRFNKEVKVLPGLKNEETQKIAAGAYSTIIVPLCETSSLSSLESMECDVPVIVSESGIFPEICGDAALYANAEKINDIAEKMMLIFKDEQMRKELIKKGRTRVKEFCENNNTTLIEIIQNVVTKNPIS